jgi:hypothetical protein
MVTGAPLPASLTTDPGRSPPTRTLLGEAHLVTGPVGRVIGPDRVAADGEDVVADLADRIVQALERVCDVVPGHLSGQVKGRALLGVQTGLGPPPSGTLASASRALQQRC